jgi:hypothetical protein
MHDSQRYRAIAGECLLAARECQPCYRKLHLSMATSWLSLARQDDIGLCKIDHLIVISYRDNRPCEPQWDCVGCWPLSSMAARRRADAIGGLPESLARCLPHGLPRMTRLPRTSRDASFRRSGTQGHLGACVRHRYSAWSNGHNPRSIAVQRDRSEYWKGPLVAAPIPVVVSPMPAFAPFLAFFTASPVIVAVSVPQPRGAAGGSAFQAAPVRGGARPLGVAAL